MNNNKVFEKVKMKIAISRVIKEEKIAINKTKLDVGKGIGIAACIAISMTGVVIASNVDDIKKYFGGLGIGIDSAIEHGYIETTDMNYINDNVSVSKEPNAIIDNMNLETKITDFLMDDHNLSVEFNFKFDNEIYKYIDINNIHNIELEDLTIIDEENKIIYTGSDKKTFDEYCNNHNLDYTFGEFNENYLNNGLECFSYYDKENKVVKLVYNMYTDKYPNSKKLNFSFNKLILTEENNENKIELNGEWEINLDVPEKMYNRQSSSYKVINCENPNFQVTKATLTDTGFEFGLIISNIEKPKAPQVLEDLFEKLENGEIEDDEYNKLVEEDEKIKKAGKQYWYQMAPIQLAETGRDTTYVENERGETFVQAGSQQEYKFVNGDKFIFYQIFGMSKYDSTDKIKVILSYYGEPVTIELEKIK